MLNGHSSFTNNLKYKRLILRFFCVLKVTFCKTQSGCLKLLGITYLLFVLFCFSSEAKATKRLGLIKT